ncbi:MAG: heparinase II/III-family protein [Bacteroidales bacterium]|jgi:hypothetical protein|nr:heparinase II/III-family protein [Bacteroidales bacterium]
MKTPFLKLALALLCLLPALSLSAQDQNLLSGKYYSKLLPTVLIPFDRWTPFPHIEDREGWAKANPAIMQKTIEFAEAHLDYDWPTVPATLSLLIARTGNRSEYQKVSYKKRTVLANMIIAELGENKGRFIDPIINGVWSICEESWWGAAAHLPVEYKGLMDVTQPRVDLYAGVTACILAWADYFLGDKFDAVTPQIRKRIHNEVYSRVLDPLMTKYHGWMWYTSESTRPNNWNPWICSNWISCALLLEKDDLKRSAMVYRALQVLDAFVNPYPEDGGSSEGPGYWGSAVGALYNNIVLLNLASNNAYRYVFENQKFKNMCTYIYRVQISEGYTVNFADAGPRGGGSSGIYRIGKDIGDENMARFGASYRGGVPGPDRVFGHFTGDLVELFAKDDIMDAPQGLALPKDVWFPVLEVATARDEEGSSKGLFFAAKGGTNGESHNHNDIGNFIVYYDGLPLLIDVGSPKYTAKTFTDRRYEIWNLCSDYHNTPTINGKTQPVGLHYKASDVSFSAGNAATSFTLDMAGAYPQEAGVNHWKRTITLNRNKAVVVRDVTDLKRAESVTQHLMTCFPAEVTGKGELTIHYKDKDGKAVPFVIRYNSSQMKAEVEKIKLETESDEMVRINWGDNVYRINFHVLSPKTKDVYTFKISLR